MKRFKYDVRNLTDETLASAKAGSRAAIDEVFRATMGLVRWRANTYPVDNNTRDDLIGIGHLAVFDAVRTFRPGKGPFAPWVTQWIHARMHTVVRSESRRDGYLREYEEHLREPERPPLADEMLETEDELVRLLRAVSSLSPKLREVLQGRLRGETLEHVGAQMGVTKEATRLREMRASALLGRRLRGAA